MTKQPANPYHVSRGTVLTIAHDGMMEGPFVVLKSFDKQHVWMEYLLNVAENGHTSPSVHEASVFIAWLVAKRYINDHSRARIWKLGEAGVDPSMW